MRIPGALVAWIGFIAAVPAAHGEDQPPAFEQLRYEEDFSYLKAPAMQTGDGETVSGNGVGVTSEV